MKRVALKGLLGRKTRAILTALAIVLGVAMISGTYVLTDTIRSAFDQIFSGSYKNTAAVISGRSVVKYSNGGNATVPASLLGKVRNVPGVAAAAGEIFDLNGSDGGNLVGRDGKVLGSSNSPTFAFGLDPSVPELNPLTLVDGRWASGPGELVIDKGTAKGDHYAVGDRIDASVNGPTR